MDTTTTMSPFPTLDSAPTPTSSHDVATIPVLSSPFDPIFHLEYEGPLYTEINIPLPRIPTSYQQPSTSTSSSASSSNPSTATDRPRGHTLSLSLSRFRPRSSSSATTTTSSSISTSSRTRSNSTTSTRHSADNPRPRRDTVKSREVNAMMDLRHQNKKAGRNGVIDALAVVPAVLVLSAELFTPGDEKEVQGRERRKDSGVARWEEGIR